MYVECRLDYILFSLSCLFDSSSEKLPNYKHSLLVKQGVSRRPLVKLRWLTWTQLLFMIVPTYFSIFLIPALLHGLTEGVHVLLTRRRDK